MANDTERMVITRIFDAPRELVWKAWTDPALVKQWWGPKGFTVPVYKADFRVGGKYLICMKSPDGQEFWNGGEYHEIVKPEKIASTMYFSDSEGNKRSSEDYGIQHEVLDESADVTQFEEHGPTQTKLTFTGNEPMKSAIESGQLEGWNQILDKFAEALTQLK